MTLYDKKYCSKYKYMKQLLFILFSMFLLITVRAQDTLKLSTKTFDSTLFASDDTLTKNDYLSGLGKIFQTLNKVSGISQTNVVINTINHQMDDDDSAINIIKKRIAPTERILNIRNVQMFYTLLNKISLDTKGYNLRLNQFDNQLDATKKEIFQLRADTLTKHIFKSQELSASLRPQLLELYSKWKNADSIIKHTNRLLDNALARTTANQILIDELLVETQQLLRTIGVKAFTKEGRYLWEPRAKISQIQATNYQASLNDEKRIAAYYFRDSLFQLYVLFAIGIVFFYWIFYNLSSVRKINKLKAFDLLQLNYVNSFPLFTSFIILLSIAPLFDLNAPSIYIEIVVLMLMAVLTVHFWKRLSLHLFYWWLFFVLIFNTLLFIRVLGLPFYMQRNLILIINIISAAAGVYLLIGNKKLYVFYKPIFWVGLLFVFFNAAAVFCNLFGRLTLTNILSLTAIYGFVQAIGLTIFVQVTKEAFLIQIQGSRLRKGYPEYFEFHEIAKGVTRLVSIVALIIWLIVFTTNLNVYNNLQQVFLNFLSFPRKLGSFSFTFSGIILFMVIIWCANFLQKYIAYFFGDTGEDAAFENVAQRSRLLITRLILLVGGFLLAVVASGLPIDRITVIIGALGVGIGLGLQSIVNNFVSGIILIFDRPMRIGDTVEIGGKRGRVKEISVRSSTLLTPEGAEVIIPNGDILSHNIINYTLTNNHIRGDISLNIFREVDAEEIRKIIIEIINVTPNILLQKPPDILISNLSSVVTQIKIYFWCKDVSKLELTKSQLSQSIYKSFEEKQIKFYN